MRETEILVIGGGPAGIRAAITAAELGAEVLLCERDGWLGGQLIKQTGKFFGREYAGQRGFEICADLLAKLHNTAKIDIWLDCPVLGIYEDGVVSCQKKDRLEKIKPQRMIIATGAAENFLAFAGNDLPGVISAGAAETLMHMSGVVPAQRALMVGAGNIGLTVSYQMIQSGVEVAAVIEAAPQIGGYLVHASKLARTGVPIKTGYTIQEAYGEGKVEGARIMRLDETWRPIPGSEEDIACDAICLAVGLNPLAELCWQAGCQMELIRELSGHVPLTDENLQTTIEGIYVAGDICGPEEATTAMAEGKLAGANAAASLGYDTEQAQAARLAALAELGELRAGPMSARIKTGLDKLREKGAAKHA
ncbi:MAG: FAD-dependent oxidoreductase [Clostridia bacterium]|nr:FAD-dependent oxidoreductase [Clostridia bacterium]